MKIYGKKIRSLRHSNEMVSDIVGVVLLLAIVVSIFSTLYVTVLSYPSGQTPPIVTIVGTLDGSNIVLEHRGGVALGPDTEIPITIAGQKLLTSDGRTPTVRDILVDSNGDGMWDIGERLVQKFNYSIDNPDADVMAIDVKTNSLVLQGTIDIHPEDDIGIKVKVSNQNPVAGSNINLTIIATNYRGDMSATYVEIDCKLPDALVYVSNYASKGTYDRSTGIWNITSGLDVGESANLNITVKVNLHSEYPTQLAMVLDGSGSISDSDWGIMLNGLADAIINFCPHDGSVELTVVEFAGYYGTLKVAPVVINASNYNSIATQILGIKKVGSYTPLACGLKLVADQMRASPNYDPSKRRQVINIVTDGQPNVSWDSHYPTYYYGEYVGTALGKVWAAQYRNYSISLLGMTSDGVSFNQDEIDVEAVGTDVDLSFLQNRIAFPQSGYGGWPPAKPGYVRHVANYTEFSQTIHEQFKLLFNNNIITSNAEIKISIPLDTNPANNKFSLTIVAVAPD